jgi:uncharacterized protein (TIGR00369 family)
MTVDPEFLAELGERMANGAPQALALGIRLVSLEAGVASMAIPWRADLVGDPATGVMAGGVITTLLDHVCGLSLSSLLGMPLGVATLDLRIDYMRVAEPGRTVIGLARCYKVTRSIAFVRASAFEDEEGDPVATAQAAFVFSVSGPSAASGAGA